MSVPETAVPILLTCPCGRSLRLKEELAGRKIVCPQCGTVLTVPPPEPAPEEVVGEVSPADESEAGPAVK